MTARTAALHNGKAAAAKIKGKVRQRVTVLQKPGRNTDLGTALVGDGPASALYVKGKHRDCDDVGIASLRFDLPANASHAQVEGAVETLNADPRCTGYIVRLALPGHLDELAVIERVDPAKYADGLHRVNLGRHAQLAVHARRHRGSPAASRDPGSRGASVRGRAWHHRQATAGPPADPPAGVRHRDLRHAGTRDLAAQVSRPDIVAAAVGVPGLIGTDMAKPGAVLLDVGATRTAEGTTAGDINPTAVAAWVSPNPGGVGPMTSAMLLANVVEAAVRAADAHHP